MNKAADEVDYGLLEGYYVEPEIRDLCRSIGVNGPTTIVSNACAAGASSLAHGARWLASRRADVVVAAGGVRRAGTHLPAAGAALADFWLAVAQASGVPLRRFGHDGRTPLLDLA